MAEAAYWGNIGSTYDKQGSLQRQYNNWYNKVNTEISNLIGDDKNESITAWSKVEAEIKRRGIKLKKKKA